MGDSSENIYCHEGMSGNDVNRFKDYPEENCNQLRQRRQDTTSTCSDTTECTVRSGSTQPEDIQFEDSYSDFDSCRNTLTFDEDWCQKNMHDYSSSAWPLQQHSYPKLDQHLLCPYEEPIQGPLTNRPSRKSAKAQDTMPKNVYAPFESSREPNQTLTNKRLGVSAELSQDQTDGARKHPSELNLPRFPFIPTGAGNQTTLPTSPKRPPLPLKPSQHQADHTWPTKTKHNRQPIIPSKEHYAQIQQFQTPEAPNQRGPPKIPPKPYSANLKPIPPPKPNNKELPPPRPPKPKPENHQPALSLEPEQNTQERSLQPPRPHLECDCQWLPPRYSPRNDRQPISVSQNIPPIVSPDPTENRLLTIQSTLEIHSTNLTHQQRQQATPSASTSSEERTESTASLAHRSNRSTPTQRVRHIQRHPHFILSIRNLLIASFTSVLLSLASMSFLVCMQLDPFNFTWRDLTFKEGAYRTCVKCLYLIQDLGRDLSNPDFKDLVNEVRNGEIYCCATSSEQMRSLLKLMLRQQEYTPSKTGDVTYPRRTSQLPGESEVTEQSVPSAHVQLHPGNVESTIFGDRQNIMVINKPKTQHHHKNHVTIDTYGLKIETPGYYYVYSSIYYKTNHLTCSTFKKLEHKILLVRPVSPTDNGILAKTAHSCCINCGDGGDKHSSFAGGVFQLMKGDQIASSVTNMSVVEFDEASYLGVVMLGE